MNSFAWLLFLLCASNLLSSFAHENSQILRSKSVSDPEEHEKNTEGQQKLYADSDGRKLMEITLAEKGQRGKGSNGGANIVHRRPGEKSGAALLRPCFFILSAILVFSFSLLIGYPFPSVSA